MPVINLEAALERFDNETEIYAELVESFLEGGGTDMEAMERALAAGDRKQALYHTHKMKGGALTLGADGFASAAEKLEIRLRLDEPGDTGALAADVRRTFDLALAELTDILGDLKKPS